MNEILILKRTSKNIDNGIFECYNGVSYRNEEESTAKFWEGNRAEGFVKSFLRKENKSVDDYDSTEEVIRSFIKYCETVTLIGE